MMEVSSGESGIVFPPTVPRKSTALKPLKDQSTEITWDFRNGELPAGIEVVGGPVEFIPQLDGSMALKLAPQSYLKVWTVTMTCLDLL
jgi:hypothetical protein